MSQFSQILAGTAKFIMGNTVHLFVRALSMQKNILTVAFQTMADNLSDRSDIEADQSRVSVTKTMRNTTVKKIHNPDDVHADQCSCLRKKKKKKIWWVLRCLPSLSNVNDLQWKLNVEAIKCFHFMFPFSSEAEKCTFLNTLSILSC